MDFRNCWFWDEVYLCVMGSVGVGFFVGLYYVGLDVFVIFGWL